MLVLVAAAFMRFYRLDAVEFFHDETMVSIMAQEMADGQTFPLQGILSSVGIPNPPTSIYVMAVPFAISSSPVFATGFVVALNVLAAGLLWAIARKYFGFVAALIAGLFFAFNPWAILYSRKIWAQDYVNPFLLLALAAALWGYKDGKRPAQIIALPLMLFAMQIHFAAWALVPLFAWIVVTGRKNISWGAVSISVILGALVMLPYLVGLTQTLQADPSRISDFLSRSGGAREGGLKALDNAAMLAMGTQVESWVNPNPTVPPGYANSLSIGVIVGGFALLLQAAGIFSLLRPYNKWIIGFAVWIALPVIGFQVGLADIWPHYFVPQLPAFALLAGIGVSGILSRIGQQNTPAITGIGLLCALTFGFYGLRYIAVMDEAYRHDITLGEGTSGYTTPMFILNEVRAAIPVDTTSVIVLTDGDRVWFDAEAARWPVILRDDVRCVRALPPDGVYVAPMGRFAVITTPTASAAQRAQYPQNETTVTIKAREGEGRYTVTVYDDLPITRPEAIEIAPQTFANGAVWTQYAVEPDHVYLTFELPQAQNTTFYGALDYDYQYFVHVLDQNDNRVGQTDKSFWPGRHWCAGDKLTVRADVATGGEKLRVGFYRILDAENGITQAVDVLDTMGNPAGNWADITISP